jgi:hypothetical protein
MLEKLGATREAWCTIFASGVLSRIEIVSAEHEDHTFFITYLSNEPFLDRVLLINPSVVPPRPRLFTTSRGSITKGRGVDMWLRALRIREGEGRERMLLHYLRDQEKRGMSGVGLGGRSWQFSCREEGIRWVREMNWGVRDV